MMVNNMKWLVSLLCGLNFFLGGAAAAELAGARTVYLMPMGHGFDQFIANRLIRMHVLQVVTDPAKADTVITDEVGATLEGRLEDLYPPPPDPEAVAAAKAKKEAAAKERAEKAEKQPGSVNQPPPSILGDTVNKADRAGTMGVSGRGRGTIFLVDVKSRQVLWSVFDKPKSSNPHELDRTAERVVKLLKGDLSPKAK
jgi:hypothetical protein